MLTETGFYRPTYDELLEAQEARAKQLFGDDIDTSNLSVLGKYIRINVSDLDELWQTLEGVYNARFPNTASGVSLERLCVFAGISRNPATYASHKVRFSGTEGTVIEGGFLVSTEAQEQTFYTLEDYVIGADGVETEDGEEISVVYATVYAETAGTEGNVPIGSITSVVNPIAGVDETVKHIEIVEYAQDIESDYELRTRFSNTIAGTGATTMEALKAAILRVESVQDVFIRENDGDDTDEHGIAPHSFECFVLAPESQYQKVAEAILSKKAAGISPTGKRSFVVVDSTGVSHTIRFTETIEKKIYIKTEIITDNFYPADGDKQILKNLTDLLSKLGNGEPVYISSLYGQIHIDGVDSVTSLQMSTDGKTWSTDNITCTLEEVARVGGVTINGVTVTDE